MSGVVWDPSQYGVFADERLRPARDLLGRVPLAAPQTLYDLGCGDGRATALIAERWPAASITAIDSSADMLAAGRERQLDVDWVQADIGAWAAPRPADLVFSNAALHWLDDHAGLFPRLVSMLAPGGALAVQMPHNHGAPSHTCMTEAAEAGPWRDRLRPLLRPSPVAAPAFYYDLLAPRSRAFDIWETEYLHVLEGDNPVVEWTRGTALRPLIAALEGAEREAFLAEYAQRVARAYPRRSDGRTLFPFRRLFFVAIG